MRAFVRYFGGKDSIFSFRAASSECFGHVTVVVESRYVACRVRVSIALDVCDIKQNLANGWEKTQNSSILQQFRSTLAILLYTVVPPLLGTQTKLLDHLSPARRSRKGLNLGLAHRIILGKLSLTPVTHGSLDNTLGASAENRMLPTLLAFSPINGHRGYLRRECQTGAEHYPQGSR